MEFVLSLRRLFPVKLALYLTGLLSSTDRVLLRWVLNSDLTGSLQKASQFRAVKQRETYETAIFLAALSQELMTDTL